MTGQISYDLVMKEDMDFAEGAYRLGGGEWQVFVAKKGPVGGTEVEPSTWESGVTGRVIRVPKGAVLNAQAVERALSEGLGVASWETVKGPDSMGLR